MDIRLARAGSCKNRGSSTYQPMVSKTPRICSGFRASRVSNIFAPTREPRLSRSISVRFSGLSLSRPPSVRAPAYVPGPDKCYHRRSPISRCRPPSRLQAGSLSTPFEATMPLTAPPPPRSYIPCPDRERREESSDAGSYILYSKRRLHLPDTFAPTSPPSLHVEGNQATTPTISFGVSRSGSAPHAFISTRREVTFI